MIKSCKNCKHNNNIGINEESIICELTHCIRHFQYKWRQDCWEAKEK